MLSVVREAAGSALSKRRPEAPGGTAPAGWAPAAEALGPEAPRVRGAGASLALLALLALLTAGCASVPAPEDGGYPSLLYQEGSVLFIFNVEKHGELAETVLSRVMDPSSADRFLRRTKRLYIRIFEAQTLPEAGPSAAGGGAAGRAPAFELIAEGRYPRKIAGFALNRDGWDKRSEPAVWWSAPGDQLQVAFPTSGLALVSQSGIESLLGRVLDPAVATPLPEEVRAVAGTSAMYIYGSRPDFSAYFDQRLAVLLSKVDDFRMGLYPVSAADGGLYRIEGRYSFKDAAAARSFMLSLRLALLTRARNEGKEAVMQLVEERYVTQQGKNVLIAGAKIATEEVYLLFGIFTPRLERT
jgi:hypothetical protein